MSSILKGIVDEAEDLAVVYIDGKPSVKYANNHEAIADVKRLRDKFPDKKVEIKYEVREDDDLEELDENLRKWFKEKWVRFGPDGKIRGACARGSSKEGKPKCLPQSKAHSIGKKGRKYAAAKKRREDPNPERRGPAKNVATKKKTNEGVPFNQCPECGGEIVHESMMNEKKDACYHKVKARYKVWPSAYASGALVQCRKKGASNWGTGGKKNESNIMKGLVAETEMMNVIYVDGHPLVKYVDKTRAESDADRIRKKFPKRNVEVKREMHEGVIVGHDANDPDVAILGGAGTYKLSNVKKKAQMEANELAKDIMDGKFKNSAINVKQLANTLNTIVAAEEEMEKGYFGESEESPYHEGYKAWKDYLAGKTKKRPVNPYPAGQGMGAWEKGAGDAAEHLDWDTGNLEEDYTGEFAAEVTPAINPYGGLKDKKVRGAIGEALLSETPTDNPTGASGEGGWRKYSPKPAGELDEDTAYAGGMGQGGNAGQSYRKFKPKSAGTFKEEHVPSNMLVKKFFADFPRAKDAVRDAMYNHEYASDAVDYIYKFVAPKMSDMEFAKIRPHLIGYFKGIGLNEEELDEACWKGYHKEGMKTMFGKKYPNCVKNTNEEEQLDEKCWDSHKQVGMKNKGGKMVPNCVPKESAIMKGLTGKRR